MLGEGDRTQTKDRKQGKPVVTKVRATLNNGERSPVVYFLAVNAMTLESVGAIDLEKFDLKEALL